MTDFAVHQSVQNRRFVDLPVGKQSVCAKPGDETTQPGNPYLTAYGSPREEKWETEGQVGFIRLGEV